MLQAVAEHCGIDSPLVPKIATGFCSGVSRTNGMCGAVSGGIMALGLVLGRESSNVTVDDAYSKVQEFLNSFELQYGARNCIELTGCDLSTGEGRERFKKEGMKNKCQEFTGSAARIAAEIAGRKTAGR